MNTIETGIFIVMAVALTGSIFLTEVVRRLAIIDVPNERSSHSTPTPRGGGIGLVAMTILGLIFSQQIWQLTSWSELLFYLFGAVLIAIISWVDDIKSLSAKVRFPAHFMAAGIVIAKWGYWEYVNIPLWGNLYLGPFGLLLTIIWIVGLTNAYNFMDGIDGIAGGQALIAGTGWAIIGWIIDDTFIFAIGGLLAASTLGFLFYNWSPAKIFMGDVGSTFLGFSFAVVPVMAARSISTPRNFIPLVGFLLIWPFVFDTGVTLLRRLSKGENIFQAHRTHIYQRLAIAGYSHQIVSLLYIGLALIGVVLALLIINKN
jgi:UDP-N-acetylmuramyl pentapeptide phosphotransferase/UDP-N-acetylglucosamine-1-phosphate transferase